jgi:hypothetical protein
MQLHKTQMSGSEAPDDANYILQELLRLQAEQTELIRRLTQIQIGAPHQARIVVVPEVIEPELPRQIQIGSRVRIRNPRSFQPTRGIVESIGPRFISVRASNGSIIKREPHNLELLG